ncbi:hypothetical protein RUND412_006482 [Rhizina undulata]
MSSEFSPAIIGLFVSAAVLLISKWLLSSAPSAGKTKFNIRIFGTNFEQPNVPYVGPKGPFYGIRSLLCLVIRPHAFFQEAYRKNKAGAFMYLNGGIPEVVVCNEESIKELRNASEEYLSASTYRSNLLKFHYTIPGNMDQVGARLKPSYFTARRHGLMRSHYGGKIAQQFENMRDEVRRGFKEELAPLIPDNNEWTPLVLQPVALMIVARISNRLFVGAPLCRNKEFLTNAIDYAHNLVVTAQVLAVLPVFMHTIVAKLICNTGKGARTCEKFLEPILDEAVARKNNGDAENKPDTFLQALTEIPHKDKPDWKRHMSIQIMSLNFAAIHTSSVTFMHTILEIAIRPEIIAPLRQEMAETIEAFGGLSHAALEKMELLDSVMHETQRFWPLSALSMARTAIKPFTFIDGTHVPAGCTVSAASGARYVDSELYPDGETFDPYRFIKLRKAYPERASEFLFSAVNSKTLGFGDGRHACPGRYFAADELKLMLIEVLENYDIKLRDGKRPKSLTVGFGHVPDPKAEVYFRRRRED